MSESCEYPTEYRIPGQGAICLNVRAGERIQVTSEDGSQGCELLPFAIEDQGWMLTEPVDKGLAAGTLSLIKEGGIAAKKLQTDLQRWQVDEAMLANAYVFAADRLPDFQARQDLSMVLVAAGDKMAVDEHRPASELKVVHFAKQPVDLPEPLAVPVKEIRIPHSSARTYEVKAGQWIQIIDVQGKQSSDFIAFDKAALEQGREMTIDGTATRTVMGMSLPQPGLFSKFLDQEQQTMLEVVQDTVGRHDSFMFACSPKYYEDQGYFGHISCTENFNNALKSYGIQPRFGWPAINFFFNTYAEPCGTIGFAEPWSRPGDYVLLRANRDLLCASSACPDDIDPANGWQPTDIHVRIYSEQEEFPRSIAYRTVPEELSRMTKLTGFHSRTSKLTKHFAEYRGYWVATEYEGWGANSEYLACREKVAMIDLTPLRKFEVVGTDAEVFMQYAVTRNVRRMSVGEIVYSAICNETGGMIDDGTLFKMSDQTFRWICGDPYTGKWLRELAEKTGHNVKVMESSDQIHNLAVQGPRSRELLAEIIWTSEQQTSVQDLAWFHFTVGRIGNAKGFPVMVSRTGYTGELGFEVWCHPDNAEDLWDLIWETGQKYGIAPMGFDALDKLRIEAGLIFAEHEFCPLTNPFEAGIGFTTPLKTNDEDFVGRKAIERQAPESQHKLMGLVTETNEPIHHGDNIYHGRFPVGVVTSATFSPLLKKQIALCRLAPDFAAIDTEIEIGQLDGQQKRIPAKVVSLPFYDPERTRVRS
ncbi:DUF1989 domain-containing protein [Thiomicrorhabdus heinhorstiae]|uniref:DUF1989 domain-containing protein n=1 Tax=Thiomicrorhabdus heinhorstiae TaxID=2748010 RepID=A0ABS0BWF4_9GAMM|nr:aminomethyltransferase family protein [Thiomicrorhabdus heinhorstiae]MBF6057395.1 DUF1989 domain-containing protein [Thiomicrorhabdus heinhorstiae]